MAINFRDTDNRVRVRIDDEENDDLIIKEIIKLPTVIQLNQTLDTALKNDIILDASLFSVGEAIDTDNTQYENYLENNYLNNFLTKLFEYRSDTAIMNFFIASPKSLS